MSPIGRIFIVLNLILSAAFLGWASNALATVQDWKEKHTLLKEDTDAALDAKDAEIGELQVELRSTQDTARSRREERDQLTVDRNNLQGRLDEGARENDQLRGDVTAIHETLGEYNDTNRQLSEEKDRAVQNAHDMQQQRDDAVAAQVDAEQARRDAENAQRGLERQIVDLEVETTQLGSEVSRLETRLQVLVEVTGVNYDTILTQPKIDGAVLAVNQELGLVMLNVGSEYSADGEARPVRRGYTFDVWSGSRYKGRVRVENVQPMMCSAVILRTVDEQTIQQGDRAGTRM